MMQTPDVLDIYLDIVAQYTNKKVNFDEVILKSYTSFKQH